MSNPTNLEDYIDKDKKEREEKERIIRKCIEFLEANGYEVHIKGTLRETMHAWKSTPTSQKAMKW